MDQIQEGLFTIEEEMPCGPRAIAIGHYMLPATLDRMEREEAAARIISFSHQLNCWVGVSWPKLAHMMLEDLGSYQTRNHNIEEGWRVQRALRKHRILCWLTLGIYSFFKEKPTATYQEEHGEVPFSGIFYAGPQAVINGLHELVEHGFLHRETEGEGDNALDIFFPTPALVTRIMQKQGVATA